MSRRPVTGVREAFRVAREAAEAVDFVTSPQIAERLGVRPVTVRKWRATRPDFPRPVIVVGGRGVWRWAAVAEWAARRAARAGHDGVTDAGAGRDEGAVEVRD